MPVSGSGSSAAATTCSPTSGGCWKRPRTLTRLNKGLTLVVAFNYGGRQEIAQAARAIARRLAAGELRESDIDAAMIARHLDTREDPGTPI